MKENNYIVRKKAVMKLWAWLAKKKTYDYIHTGQKTQKR